MERWVYFTRIVIAVVEMAPSCERFISVVLSVCVKLHCRRKTARAKLLVTHEAFGAICDTFADICIWVGTAGADLQGRPFEVPAPELSPGAAYEFSRWPSGGTPFPG